MRSDAGDLLGCLFLARPVDRVHVCFRLTCI